MAPRKYVKPLRSLFIFPEKQLAVDSLYALCDAEGEKAPKDGELVTSRYHDTDENKQPCVKSVMGLFNLNEGVLSVTIYDNQDAVKEQELFWEELG